MNIGWNKYNIYFDVDSGYYPEINEDSVKDPNNRWEKTYAHESVVSAIVALERILSRAGNTDKKSLWIEGSYGTGKSRLLWTLQNLLECPAEDLVAYFNANESLRMKIDLREKLLAAKSKRIITTFRYASGEIVSTKNLIHTVFDSLTASLKTAGCEFNGAKTLRGKIIAWLEADEANLQLFRAKIRNPKYRGVGAFAGKTADEILDRLKNSELSVDELVDEILKLGEQEGIRAFEINIDDLKLWISEVIDANKLKAIVFFWDEFTDFLHNNRNNLSDFQKLVELVNSKPFYFVIATHMSDSFDGDESFKKLRDRFINRNITMPNNIAFELIGHALKVKSAAAQEWSFITDTLAKRTLKSRRAVAEYIKTSEKILLDILPIHPMAALMLKNISTYFASNQRSMFNFIKTETTGVEAFQHFISTRSPQVGEILTTDYLWKFFYEQGTDEHAFGRGRTNLDFIIATILDSYSFYADRFQLTDVEQIVLKVVLMMEAVTRKSQLEYVKLLQPSATNLELTFEGVDSLDGGVAVNIARTLVEKKILYRQAGPEEIFATAAMSGDQVEIDDQRATVLKNFHLSKLIDEAKLIDEFTLSAAQRLRLRIDTATVETFSAKLNKLTRDGKPFQVSMLICFACDENEMQLQTSRIRDALSDSRYRKIIFVDASECFFGKERLNRWADYMSHTEYWRTRDSNLSNQNKSNAEDVLQEWRRSFRDSHFLLYPATRTTSCRRPISCTKLQALKTELDKNIQELYPLSFDSVDVSESLFSPTANSFRKGAQLGIRQETYGLFSQTVVQKLLGDVWHRDANYWETQPTLSISKLKLLVDKFIGEQLSKNIRVSFDEIFDLLMANGFMPSNLYALLTGFLLKEYAGEPYRFNDAAGDFGAMSVEHLSTFIAESMSRVLTPKKNVREKFLEIMSQGQRAFLKFAHEVFETPEDIAIEQVTNKIRAQLTEKNLILWLYELTATKQYKPFCQQLIHLVNTRDGYNVAMQIEQLGNFLLTSRFHMTRLKTILTSKKTLEPFLKNFAGGQLFAAADSAGVTGGIIEDVQKKLSGAALWEEETAVERINELILEYKIMAASRTVGVEGKTFSACIENWSERVHFLRVPCEIMSEQIPLLQEFFATLYKIEKREEISSESRTKFLYMLENHPAQIRTALTSERDILTKAFANLFEGMSDDDKKNVVTNLPTTSFIDDRKEFVKRLTPLTESAKKKKLSFELNRLWQTLTQSKSPRVWSEKNQTPILALVDESERLTARRIFETAMSATAPESEIKFAIQYLQAQPTFLKKINDKQKINEAFISQLIGAKKILLNDLTEVRVALEEKFGSAYDWCDNSEVQSFIENLAREKYFLGASEQVVEHLMTMDERRAKEFLIRLVKDNYKIGIEILNSENR